MKKLFLLVFIVVLISAFILSSCAAPAPVPVPAPKPSPAPVTPKEVKLDIWGGPFGGTPYVAGFSLVDTLNKTHPWLHGSIIESKGSWDNVLNSDADKAKLPYIVCGSDFAAFSDILTGTAKPWIDAKRPGPAKPGDRLVIATYGNAAQYMVTFDANIKSGKDLAGRRVAGWTRGSGAWTTLVQMNEQWGITDKDYKSYDGMDPKPKIDALKDGLVDAIHLSEPYQPGNKELRSSSLAELITTPKKLLAVPVTKEEADVVAAKYKAAGQYFFRLEIRAGYFVPDWPATGSNVVPSIFWVYKEMPEEMQYEIAKTLIEKNDVVVAHGGQASIMVPAVLVGSLPIESESQMAPGALKYYKEKGLWTKYPPPFLKK